MGLLFSSLDTSIVSTSLVTISHDLDDFVNAPWIVLAYLLTYMGQSIFPRDNKANLPRLRDLHLQAQRHLWAAEHARRIVGALYRLLHGLRLCQGHGSTVRMLGGRAKRKLTAIRIVCRAFQGVGASGLYSLTQIGLVEVGPVHRPSLIGAMVGATLAVAFVLGPLIGGIVSQLSDWRWLFNMK